MTETHTAPGAGAAGSTRPTLTRVTVNLIPAAMGALTEVSLRQGESQTDALNRAIQVYNLITKLIQEDGGMLRLIRSDGTEERIRLL